MSVFFTFCVCTENVKPPRAAQSCAARGGLIENTAFAETPLRHAIFAVL